MNFLEVNPDDARAWGFVSGDLLSIESDDVIDQLGDKTTGSFTAVAYVSDSVPPRVGLSRTSSIREVRRMR